MTRRSLPRAGLVLLAWALAPDAGHAMATEVPPLDGTNWVLVDLPGTSWRVTGINNGRQAVVSVLEDTQVTLQFDREGRVAGSAGCNRYTAGYTAEGTSLRIGQAAVTRMACARPDGAMAQEQQFLAALATVTTARIEGDRLELRTSDGALAVGATRAD